MMKKLFWVIMVVFVLTACASASGEALNEVVIKETIINETTINEIVSDTNLVVKEEKIPNYVITIGGDKLIDIKVNRHFGWIEAIGNGVNVAKDFCVDAGNTIADTAVNAYEETVGFIRGILGRK